MPFCFIGRGNNAAFCTDCKIWLAGFRAGQPACRSANNRTMIGNVFRQEGLLQVPILYLFEEIGVLFEMHCRLILRDDDTDFLDRAEFFEFCRYRGKVAVPGEDKGSIKFIRNCIGKQGDGDVNICFFLLMGLVPAFAKGTFAVTKVEFSQNIPYSHGTECVDIEQVLLGPVGQPGSQRRKVVDGGDFLMFGVDEAFGQFPKVKPAAVPMGMLEGAVVEVKAVYVDTYAGFIHTRRLLPGRRLWVGPE